MQKKIINVLQDDIYTILEFEDHTFLPLISINNLIMALIKDDSIKNDLFKDGFIKNDLIKDKECIYCHRKNIKLCTLDNQHYLCLDCATRIVENFAQLGLPIDLNLGKINPKLISKLQEFISGNMNVDKTNFIVNTNNNIVNTNTFFSNNLLSKDLPSRDLSTNNLSKKNDLINLQAQAITKRANIVHASAKIIDKDLFDKSLFSNGTFDKNTLDKDTLDEDNR